MLLANGPDRHLDIAPSPLASRLFYHLLLGVGQAYIGKEIPCSVVLFLLKDMQERKPPLETARVDAAIQLSPLKDHHYDRKQVRRPRVTSETSPSYQQQ